MHGIVFLGATDSQQCLGEWDCFTGMMPFCFQHAHVQNEGLPAALQICQPKTKRHHAGRLRTSVMDAIFAWNSAHLVADKIS